MHLACERQAFHERDWQSVKRSYNEHPVTAMHERVVQPRLVDAAPSGSLLIDVGSGPRPRKFAHGALAAKQLRLLCVDYAEPETQSSDVDWVQADLRRLPFPLWGHKPMLDGLQSFLTFPGVTDDTGIDALRQQVSGLIAILERRPVGACVFSHVLRYLPDDTRDRLLNLAAQTVMPGGSIVYVERPRAMEKFFLSADPDYGPQHNTVHTLLSQAGMRLQLDAFFSPELSIPQVQQLRSMPPNPALQERQLIHWVRGNAANIRQFPASVDNGEDGAKIDENGFQVLLSGLRYIHYVRPKN